MKIVFFVSNAGSVAGRPGDAQNTLRLGLPPKSDQIDDANADVFPDEAKKSGFLEAQGLSDKAIGQFRAGQRVVVTIEAID